MTQIITLKIQKKKVNISSLTSNKSDKSAKENSISKSKKLEDIK
ncbi:3890_t:CDS:2 [Racocetra fulgida]|uniref:3890_t:CDS:1 n=1 Tax=Racocetra fulgida TaxID=60492 RepID=A0A9N8ZRS3_9GLOM|nr:3890_t:CDS:2 [Racocetra fulgida]